jgi:hypothetical protein
LAAVCLSLTDPPTLTPDTSDPSLEHLATILQDQSTAGQFKNGYRKQFEALAPYTKPETAAVPTSGLRTVATLKPKYHCLSCTEVCLNSERKAHTKKTGHVFCKYSSVLTCSG